MLSDNVYYFFILRYVCLRIQLLLKSFDVNVKYLMFYETYSEIFLLWAECVLVLIFLISALKKVWNRDARFIARYSIQLPVSLFVFFIRLYVCSLDALMLWYYLWWLLLTDYERIFCLSS